MPKLPVPCSFELLIVTVAPLSMRSPDVMSALSIVIELVMYVGPV